MPFPFYLHSAAVSNSHLPCHAHAILRPCRSSKGHSTAVERRPCCALALRITAWSEHGMTSVNQTRPHCVNQMGKRHCKPLAARHGRGTAWVRHGNSILCVNRSLEWRQLDQRLRIAWRKVSSYLRDIAAFSLNMGTDLVHRTRAFVCNTGPWA